MELIKRHENTCEFKICEECGLAKKEVNIFEYSNGKKIFICNFKKHDCVIELKKVIKDLKNQLEKLSGFTK